MNNVCDPLLERLMDAPADRPPELTPVEAAHLRDCAGCREVWSSLRVVGPLLEGLGAAARAADTDAHSAVKARTLTSLKRELARRDAPVRPQAVVAKVEQRRRALWEVWFTPGWAMAAAALLILLAGGVWIWAHNRPLGTVRFAQAALRLDERQLNGAADVKLAKGAVIHTSPAGGALVDLTRHGAVRMALAPETQVAVLGQKKLRLDSGEVWLNVDPAGIGFQIETAQGTVTVKGTVYGVGLKDRTLRVSVERGKVEVAQGAAKTLVTAGETVAAGVGGVGAVAARGEQGLPAWVQALGTAEVYGRAATYVPSVTLKHTK